jgi:hypothetical protein
VAYCSTTAGASLVAHPYPESLKIVAWAIPSGWLSGSYREIPLDEVGPPWSRSGEFAESRCPKMPDQHFAVREDVFIGPTAQSPHWSQSCIVLTRS